MPKTKQTKDRAPYAVKGFCAVTPVPKGRPRFNSKTHITYTPKATADYESAVRDHFIKRYGLYTPPMDGPLLARYEFILPKPKSARKKDIYKDTKPDIDNLVKSFQDALDFKTKSPEGFACGVIANDSRVAILATSKRYVRDGEIPGTRYCIQKLDSTLVVLDDDVDRTIGDILIPSIPAILLSQAKQIALDNAGSAYGSASGVTRVVTADGVDPIRNVYAILSVGANRNEVSDILRTAFPKARLICIN